MTWFRDIPLSWPLTAGWLAAINAIAGICYLAAWPQITLVGPTEECFEVAGFEIGSSRPLARLVRVTVASQDDSIVGGEDYQDITLGPSRQWKKVEVPLVRPTEPVSARRVSLELVHVEGARAAPRTVSATLGPWPEIRIKDTTVAAEPGITPVARFEVQIAPRVEHDVTVQYATQDGSAKAPRDYLPAAGTIIFPTGETSQHVEIVVNPGRQDGTKTAFALRLDAPTRAVVTGGGEAECIIVYPLPPPQRVAVSIEDGRSVIDEGTTPAMVLPVRLDRPYGHNKLVRVAYRTEDGTAHAARDYIPAKGELVFEPSESEKRIVVPLTGDLSDDVPKSFSVHLAPKDPDLDYKRASAVATLTYAPPLLTGKVASEPTADEPGEMKFELQLSRPTHAVALVECRVQPGTAKPQTDYMDLPAKFAVQWPPGETTRIVSVRTVANPHAEKHRTFDLLLENPQGLRLTMPRLQGRIGPALRFLGDSLILVVPTTLLRDKPALLKDVNQIAQKRPKDVWRLGRGGLAAPWKTNQGSEVLGEFFQTECSEDVRDAFRSAFAVIKRFRQRAESSRFNTFIVWCSNYRPDDLDPVPDLTPVDRSVGPRVYLGWWSSPRNAASPLLSRTFRQDNQERVYLLGGTTPPQPSELLDGVEQALKRFEQQKVQP